MIQPRFTIIDETSKRLDLAQRRESKFAVRNADIAMIRRILESNASRLVHNESVSTVRSVYYDDFQLSAGNANIDGLGIRRKLRLRWYDTMVPGTEAFLEIKWRNNRITGKHRMKIQSDCPLGELSYREWNNALMKSVSPEYIVDLLANPEPTLLVEYKREHFASHDGNLRMTIDYDLVFYDQTGKRAVTTSHPNRFSDLIVIEGKTPIGLECEIKKMMFPIKLRATRCSKYVYGLKTIGLIPVQA